MSYNEHPVRPILPLFLIVILMWCLVALSQCQKTLKDLLEQKRQYDSELIHQSKGYVQYT